MDEILSEVRRIREAYAAEFGYDIQKMVEDLKRRQAESGRKVVSFPPKRCRPVNQAKSK